MTATTRKCSVDAWLSNSPHTANQPHPDWHIRTASGQEFWSCDAHLASLLYYDGPNTVTSAEAYNNGKEAPHYYGPDGRGAATGANVGNGSKAVGS